MRYCKICGRAAGPDGVCRECKKELKNIRSFAERYGRGSVAGILEVCIEVLREKGEKEEL